MKKLWIAIAVVLVIAAVVAGIILLGGGENGETPVNPTTTPGKTIQQPGGGKATLNFEGPPELEMSFEEFKVEMGEFRVVGTVKNVSSDTTIVIELSGVGIFVKGEQVAALFNPEKELKPGDTWKIQKGFIYLVPEEEEVDMFVKVMNFRKVETQPTTTPTGTTEPAITEPETPQEVITALLSALVDCDYDEFKKYTTPIMPNEEFEGYMNSEEGKDWRENFESFEVTSQEIEGDEARIEGIFYFKKATSSYPDATDPSVAYNLVKVDGEWKVVFD